MVKFKAPFALTEVEQKIFALLLSVKTEVPLNFYAAGGWVRDKLLGKDCDDLDVAIDGATGQQFCQMADLRSHVIKAKPEQSKHLETASIDLFGQKVEFTNLRDEGYADAYDESRILKVNKFGTPKSDASRRDLTVNALFYNVRTGNVEDHNDGWGLNDLGFVDNGYNHWERRDDEIRLRTPLAPTKTFADDPLRILRAFRFCAKLPNAFLDDTILDACSDTEVQVAFRDRVSQERVMVELLGKKDGEGLKKGILSFPAGPQMVRVMYALRLLDKILDVPQMSGFKPFNMQQNSSHHSYDVFEHTIRVMEALWQESEFLALPPHRQSLLQFAALLHDLGKRDPACCQKREDGWDSYVGHENSSAVVARAIANKLSMSNDDIDYVVKIVSGHMLPHSEGWGSPRTLRRFRHNYPDCWEDVIVHAKADVLGTGTTRTPAEVGRYDELLRRGRELMVAEKDAPPTNKPIIDGRIVMQMIPEIPAKSGYIREVNAALLEMRLERPETTSEEYLAKIMEMKPALLKKHRLV